MECLNCKTIFEGNFCPNCGQKSQTKRFTFGKIINDAFKTITNTDKGLFSNFKNLTLHPGKYINGYIEGKRINVFNPFSYALIAIGLYLFMDHYYDYSLFESFKSSGYNKERTSNSNYNFWYQVGYFTYKYIKYFFLLNIFYLSILSALILKKRNFVEHIVINSFIVGHAIIISTLLIPNYSAPIIFNPLTYLIICALMYQVYKKYDYKLVVVITILLSILSSTILQFIAPLIGLYLKSLV